MKRLTRIALGIASTVSGLFVPCLVQGATEETIIFDMAVDCRTFKYNRGVPLEQIVAGDGYTLTANVFPAGTLRFPLGAGDPFPLRNARCLISAIGPFRPTRRQVQGDEETTI